jgi:GTP-binding protein
MFIDEAKVYVRSGRGGDGMIHFHREKFVPRGGPDGGDGGRGGDVVLEVSPTLNTLSLFRHRSQFMAADGEKGGPNDMTGRSAENLVILVPPGTVVRDADTGELLGDLVEPHQRLLVAPGGRGGRGNPHFANSRIQAPRTGEKGEPGQERNLALELKLIADVGIVGVPNAGKSSLLASVTRATPKIADYPFTTIDPNLGVAELDEENNLILADIPGLIEGAHQGVGLGFSFLKHIVRTRVLIHVLDGMSEDPIADFSQINSEMALFDPQLGKKPQVVAVNKIDLPDVQERWPEIKQILEKKGYQPIAISAVAHTNVKELLWKASELLKTAPPIEETAPTLPVYKPAEDPRAFTIEKTQDGWQVHGRSIERAAEMTYWDADGSVRRFQKIMDTLGVEDALRKAGVQEGDTVFIGDYELEWQD